LEGRPQPVPRSPDALIAGAWTRRKCVVLHQKRAPAACAILTRRERHRHEKQESYQLVELFEFEPKPTGHPLIIKIGSSLSSVSKITHCHRWKGNRLRLPEIKEPVPLVFEKTRLLILKVVPIAAWSLAAAIVVLSLVPPNLRPQSGIPHELEHFLIFLATGLAFGLSYDARHGLLAMKLAVFAGAVELAQLFVPGRHARFSDFLVDTVAVCAGSVAVFLVTQLRAHRIPRPDLARK